MVQLSKVINKFTVNVKMMLTLPLADIQYYKQIFIRRIIENIAAFFLMNSFFSLASPLQLNFSYLFIPVGLSLIFLRGNYILIGLFLGGGCSTFIMIDSLTFSVLWMSLTIGCLVLLHNKLMQHIGPTSELVGGVNFFHCLKELLLISLFYSLGSIFLLNNHGISSVFSVGYFICINTLAVFLGVILFYPCLLRLFNLLLSVKELLSVSSIIILLCFSVLGLILNSYLLLLSSLFGGILVISKKKSLIEKQIVMALYGVIVTSMNVLDTLTLDELIGFYLLWVSLSTVIFYWAINRNRQKNVDQYTF